MQGIQFKATKALLIVRMLERVSRIFKQCAEQMFLMETITPLDFMEFRSTLTIKTSLTKFL